MTNGYAGKILWVDLTRSTIAEEVTDEALCRQYYGGYGLGVGVELDEAQRPTLTSAGAYGWSSAASCRFWVDPQEELIGLSMLQALWGSGLWAGERLQNLVYQAIAD